MCYRAIRSPNECYHSVGKPAYQEWFDNGLRKLEVYYTVNVVNNPTGPAVSKWLDTGYLIRYKYYSHGSVIHKDFLTKKMENNLKKLI